MHSVVWNFQHSLHIGSQKTETKISKKGNILSKQEKKWKPYSTENLHSIIPETDVKHFSVNSEKKELFRMKIYNLPKQKKLRQIPSTLGKNRRIRVLVQMSLVYEANTFFFSWSIHILP